MADTMPIDVTYQQSRAGTWQGYIIRPKIRGVMKYEDTIKSVADATRLTQAQVRGAFDQLMKTIELKAIKDQMRVKLGFADVQLTVKGSLSDLAEPLAGRCEASLSFQPAKELNDLLRNVELVNETKTVQLVLHTIVEQGHPNDTNKLFTANTNVSITTNCGRIDTSRDDEGVWLVNADGEKVATGVVTTTNSAYSIVQFATLPEPGEYKLVYACRNGEDAGEYTPAVKTRNVTVVGA